jgi:hypothetical protein
VEHRQAVQNRDGGRSTLMCLVKRRIDWGHVASADSEA